MPLASEAADTNRTVRRDLTLFLRHADRSQVAQRETGWQCRMPWLKGGGRADVSQRLHATRGLRRHAIPKLDAAHSMPATVTRRTSVHALRCTYTRVAGRTDGRCGMTLQYQTIPIMSLLKAPKKAMREYYVKAPPKGATTAYICRQHYDPTAKRTCQTRLASFNVATDPAVPAINVTERGRAEGYDLPPQHKADVQRWLRKFGTHGKTRVPASVVARMRVELAAELAAQSGPLTLGERIRAMCKATEDVRTHLVEVASNKRKGLDLTSADRFELSIHLNFSEKAVRRLLKSRGISAREHAVTALKEEAAEAIRRGILPSTGQENEI